MIFAIILIPLLMFAALIYAHGKFANSRPLIDGAIGSLLTLIVLFVVVPQYADYRTRAETGLWLVEVQAAKDRVENYALKNRTLSGANKAVMRPDFSLSEPKYFEAFENGVLIMQGGRDGQLVVLIPKIENSKVVWQCIGGSASAVPTGCRNSR